MKKIIYITAMFLAAFVTSCVKDSLPIIEVGNSSVKINEAYSRGGTGYLSSGYDIDWVELYNDSDAPADVSGFMLYDKSDKAEFIIIPANTTIAAHGFLVVIVDVAGGFGLSSNGDMVYLEDKEGRQIDFIEFGAMQPEQAYARNPDGSDIFKIQTPTPNASNNGVVGQPSITNVTRTPQTPAPNGAVVISATVTAGEGTLQSVTLKWKLNSAAQTDIPMTASGDIYSATIPGQATGAAVEYDIVAKNSVGGETKFSGSYAVVDPSATDYTVLRLNEISGVGNDPEKFYELINTGTADIDLAGCKIYYNANGSNGGTLPTGDGSPTWEGCSNQTIQAGQLLSLVGRNTACSFTTGLTAGRILIIKLKDPNGNVIDSCIRAEDTGTYAFTDKSFSRIPDGTGAFYFTTPTPNAINGTSTSGLTLVPQTQTPVIDYTKLKINEVNGCSGEKWFEIYNTGTVAINLDGVKAYYDNASGYSLTWTGVATDNISGGGWFSTKGTNLNTGLSANNANVKLQLREPDGITVLDTYQKPAGFEATAAGYPQLRDKAHARIPNGTGDWYYLDNTVGTSGLTNGTSTTGYTKFGEENGTTTVDYTKLKINEVNGNDKYVEIYNSGTENIPLNGVKLQRNDGQSEWVGTAADAIPAGAYRLFLFNSHPTSLESNPAYVGWNVSSGISAGQILKVAIVDPSAEPVSVFIRGEALLPAWQSTAGVTSNSTDSYSRMSDGSWAYASPTPGTANGTKTTAIMSPGYLTDDAANYAKLILTEVSGNNKYVEIYNSGTTSISLTGVKLQRNDGQSEWVGTASDAIPAGAYRLFLFNSHPTSLESNPAYVGWNVGSGISSGQILKVAIVSPTGNAVSIFIRGDAPLPAWGSTSGVTQNSADTYSRMTNGTWAYADPTPGVDNGTAKSAIASPGYLTAQP